MGPAVGLNQVIVVAVFRSHSSLTERDVGELRATARNLSRPSDQILCVGGDSPQLSQSTPLQQTTTQTYHSRQSSWDYRKGQTLLSFWEFSSRCYKQHLRERLVKRVGPTQVW